MKKCIESVFMEDKLNGKITSLNDLRALSAMLVVMSHINCTSEF